jgi:hypothetical protein
MAISILEHRLSAVASRLHRLRVLRRQSACWLLVIVPAVVLCQVLPTSGLPLRRESLSLIVASVLGLILARRKQTTPTWLEAARLVEQHNPGLNDVVLTAVRQKSTDFGVSPVLASRVREEADTVALVSDWASVVSRLQMFKWLMASLLAFAALVTSVVAAGRLLPTTSANNALTAQDSATLDDTTRVLVEPGDTEIERGTGVTVVARFQGPPPSHAAVRFRPDHPHNDGTTADEQPAPAISTLNMSLTVDAGVFTARLPAVARDGSYVVVYGNDDSWLPGRHQTSSAYRINTFVRPRVTQVDASITPPAWTGREPSTIEDTLRIVAIEGATVTLRIYLNKPVTSSHLESDSNIRIPLTVLSAEKLQLEATITASDDSVLTVSLQDEQGRSASEDTQITLKIIENEPPAIRITFPQPDNSVSALQEVTTEAEMEDDFGIIDYGITYSLSGGDPRTLPLAEDTETPATTASTAHTMDLESLGAEPNDLLMWNFYADTYVTGGRIHRSLSDLMLADVRRFEEMFHESRQPGGQGQPQQSGGPADDLLQIQRQIAVAIWNIQRSLTGSTRTVGNTTAKDVNTVRKSQEVALVQLDEVKRSATADPEVSDAIEAAGNQMIEVVDALTEFSLTTPEPTITDASSSAQAAFRQLLRLRSAEHDIQRSQSKGGQGSGQQNRPMQEQLNQLELDNDRNRYETEQQAQQDSRTDEQRDQLQVLSRLRELARRQNMLNERLKQLESELRHAETDDERDHIQRELKRLRDEQQELLRDVDELTERMDQSRTRNNPEQSQLREQVAQARKNVRQASRALNDGQLSEALSEGTRAERQFDQLQQDFRNQTSSAFAEAARDLRQQARELSQRQQELANQLSGEQQDDNPDESPDRPPSLRSRPHNDGIERKLGQQRDDLQRILEQSKELIERSEDSEPLLARRLYEAVQQVQDMRTEDALRTAEFLAGRGLWPQVTEPEQAARRGIRRLQKGIEGAAESVLGGETESLQLAQKTLEKLSEELSDELSEATGRNSTESSDDPQRHQETRREDGTQQENTMQRAEPDQNENGPLGQESQSRQKPAESSSDSSGQNTSSQSESESESESPQSSPGQATGSPKPVDAGQDGPRSPSGSAQQSGPGGQQSSETPSGQSNYSILRGGGRESGSAQTATSRPLTGNDFVDWSDRLRDVEELLDDPEMRQQVARVRDRARSMRAEFRRHGTEPQWDLVESGLLDEMQSLQRRLAQEIAALTSDRNMAPIDREPVPEEFDELVQRYYELLGLEWNEAAP